MATPRDPTDWLRAYAKIQKAYDLRLRAILRQAMIDIDRDIKRLIGKRGIGDRVRLQQMLIVRQNIYDRLHQLYLDTGKLIEAGRLETGAAAINLGSEVNQILFAAAGNPALGEQLRAGMLAGLRSTIEVVTTRLSYSQIPLSERIYNSELWAQGRVERLINSALARGLSAREFAAEARALFNPDVPGGINYAANRLARTELNNAFHAISINNVAGAPWVTAMQWHLSGSHPKADECDKLATQDAYDLGPGTYPAENVPLKPHPQCFCYITPVTVDEDVFVNNLLAGHYNSYIRTFV